MWKSYGPTFMFNVEMEIIWPHIYDTHVDEVMTWCLHGAYVAPTYDSIMHWDCVFPLGNTCPLMGTFIIPT